MSEHDEQVEFFRWVDQRIPQFPKLAAIFAIPNAGKRSFETGRRMKREGLRKGVLDICVPIASSPYYGMFVEMKWRNGGLSPEQVAYKRLFESLGWKVAVCYSAEEAVRAVAEYLGKEFFYPLPFVEDVRPNT